MKTTEAAVRVTRSFDLPISRIWNAITSHPEMVQWYFEALPAFEAKKGFETSFEVRSEQRVFTHQWEVVEVIKEKKISYTWSYKEYPGDSLFTMELEETGKTTLLAVTHKTTADFPEDIPEFQKESCLAGWTYFIHERLAVYLESLKT